LVLQTPLVTAGVALPERRRMLVGDELDQAPDADAVVRTGTST
jgi:hypothetical protein